MTTASRYHMDSETVRLVTSWTLSGRAPCREGEEFECVETIRGFLEDRDAEDSQELLARHTLTELYDLATRVL